MVRLDVYTGPENQHKRGVAYSRWRVIGVILLVLVAGLVVRNQIRVQLNRKAGREAAALAAAQEPAAPKPPAVADPQLPGSPQIRQQLFDALRPVVLSKCRLQRFGEANDGGYLLCANLLAGARAGYSYGIDGYDQWGCDVSTRLHVPVHEYDCFNPKVPVCQTGRTIFHSECVGIGPASEDGRLFDSVAGQLTKNGDAARHVVMKMDVEGAEWDSLLALPDEMLERIDQLTIELHGVGDEKYVRVVQRLKRLFHVAHIHFNNFSCRTGLDPFPSWAYEVLFVNRRLDTEDPSRTPRPLLPIDARNNLGSPDCQTTGGRR